MKLSFHAALYSYFFFTRFERKNKNTKAKSAAKKISFFCFVLRSAWEVKNVYAIFLGEIRKRVGRVCIGRAFHILFTLLT